MTEIWKYPMAGSGGEGGAAPAGGPKAGGPFLLRFTEIDK